MSTFCTEDPNVRNDWLTVGPASRLQGTSRAQPLQTRLLGAELALWRDDAGQPRCRNAKDSLPVIEQYAYLWVHTGSATERPLNSFAGPPRERLHPLGGPGEARAGGTLFSLPEFDQPGRRIVDCGGIGVATSGLRVVENFLDMGHFPYIHTGTLGKVPHTAVAPYDVRLDADTQEIWATNCRFFQPRASASAAAGIDAHYTYRVMQPFTAALYKSCPNRDDAQDVIGLFVQPLDDEHVVAYCLLVYFEDRLGDAEMVAFQHMIFGQDKPILESQQPRRMPLAGALEAHMRCDRTSATYRRWLKSRGMVFGVFPEPTA